MVYQSLQPIFFCKKQPKYDISILKDTLDRPHICHGDSKQNVQSLYHLLITFSDVSHGIETKLEDTVDYDLCSRVRR